MAANQPYFQFPLCLLSYEAEQYSLSQMLIGYCLLDAGRKMMQKLSDEIIDDRTTSCEIKYGECDEDDVAITIAAQAMNVTIGSLHYIKNQYKSSELYKQNFESQYGKDPNVRLRNDIIWNLNGKKISERKFRVLAGLYSIIGTKKAASATYKNIAIRAMGYKSEKVYLKEKENAVFSRLSDRQVGTTIKQLEVEGWFCSFRPNRRKNYYSIRMNLEELAAYCNYSKTKRNTLDEKKKLLIKKYKS